MGSLIRLTSKLHNTPHLITQDYFNKVLDYLDARNDSSEMSIMGGRVREREELVYDEDRKVGVLSITGPLTYLEYLPLCGEEPTSYQRLESEAAQLIDLGAKTIILDINSPGGEAYGCFEAAYAVRAMCDSSGVKLIGYVDGIAASAGYAWACACHELHINPMAEVGSIGVVVCLVNYSKMEKNMGIERRYITYGEEKVPFDVDGNFSAPFIQDIQEKINALGDAFTSHVAEFRGISKESVQGTRAKMFTAEKALVLGLADSVMTRSEFITYLADIKEPENKMKFPWQKDSPSKMEQQEGADVAKLEEMQSALVELGAKYEGVEAKLSAVVAELATKSEQLEAALSALGVANTKLADIQTAEKASLEKAQKEKTASRLSALQEVAGDEKGAQMAAEMASLSDTAFNMIVSQMTVYVQAENDQESFSELGLNGEGKSEDVKPVSFASFMPNKKSKKK